MPVRIDWSSSTIKTELRAGTMLLYPGVQRFASLRTHSGTSSQGLHIVLTCKVVRQPNAFAEYRSRIAVRIQHAKPFRIRNQFGERMNLHLRHHLVAMCFYGALGRSQLKSDLLVDLAADDQIENLSLAWRQGRYEPAKGIELAPLMACGLVALHGALDRVDQSLRRSRLGQA